jgi:hypothetical protein
VNAHRHGQAPTLLATVQLHGPAKDLTALLAAKDESHYGLNLVSAAKSRALLRRAHQMVVHARDALSG